MKTHLLHQPGAGLLAGGTLATAVNEDRATLERGETAPSEKHVQPRRTSRPTKNKTSWLPPQNRSGRRTVRSHAGPAPAAWALKLQGKAKRGIRDAHSEENTEQQHARYAAAAARSRGEGGGDSGEPAAEGVHAPDQLSLGGAPLIGH
eukprot:172079-Prymnesium_polylepis.1